MEQVVRHLYWRKRRRSSSGNYRSSNPFIRKTDAEESGNVISRRRRHLIVLIGSKPLKDEEKDAVKKHAVDSLLDEEIRT